MSISTIASGLTHWVTSKSGALIRTSTGRRRVTRRAAVMLATTAALVVPGLSHLAQAQAFPDKPIKIVVPFAAGGGTDVLTRHLAERIRTNTTKPVVIDNRGGAGSLVGTELAARATADGYTLLVNSDLMLVFPLLFEKVTFDPAKDLTPISVFATAPLVLVASTSSGISGLDAFMAAAKSEPAMSLATPGAGTPQDLAALLLSRKGGISFNRIQYKGTSPALTDVLAGHVPLGVFTLTSVEQYAREGKLKIVAIFAGQRDRRIANVPTMAEAGIDGADVSVSYCLFGPAGMPKPVLDRLQTILSQIAKDDDYKADLLKIGYEPAFTTPVETGRWLQRQRDRWTPLLSSGTKKP